MVTEPLADELFAWYEENYNHKPLFHRKKPELSLETSLSTGDMPWARETGDEIMKDYFRRFQVDDSHFDFLIYWPYEKGLLPNFLRPKACKVPDVEAKPLTLRMLLASAEAGEWLFDRKDQ
ncbi:DUF1493 family protein [Pantoea sp. A4]|uniref:DUF1493 family protein n=1 Tax=Pantoea sp. A4 TaxID=1225184 RepID=UPI00037B4FE5|nr:DUF1493 family protein [Pantoea sp. A4]